MNRAQPLRLTDFTFTDVTVQQLGAGGFGLVFMGPDRLLAGGGWSALKTLRPELVALRPQLQQLFVDEGLTWVGLWPHPNLLTAQGVTEIDGRLFLVLDYARGGSLRDLLALDQPFATRLAWAQHIAAGLLALHTPDPEFLRPFPLVHRDLKPENVLVEEHGRAQITDFGLAAKVAQALQQPDAAQADMAAQAAAGASAAAGVAVGAETEEVFALIERLAEQAAQAAQATQATQASHASRATRTVRFQTRLAPPASGTAGIVGTRGATRGAPPGTVAQARGGVGTLAYMPPEQWLADGAVGTPADLYAFGLLLSELLAGRHGLGELEAERSEADWYALHTTGAPRPLRGGPADGAARLPAAVEDLYQGLLAKRAEARPSAGEALAVLQQAAVALGEAPYTPEDGFPRTDEHRLVVWHNWAIAYFNFGRLEEALERNQRALALAPTDFNALNTRGNIVAQLGLRARAAGQEAAARARLEEALGWYERALAAASTDAEQVTAHGGRGARLNELGRYGEAEAAYAAGIALDAESGILWYNRTNNLLAWAQTESAAGREAAARALLGRAEASLAETARLLPNDPGVASQRAALQQLRRQL